MVRPLGATGALLAGGALLVAGTTLGTGLGLAVDRVLRPQPVVTGAAPPPVRLGPPVPLPAPPRIGPPTEALDAGDRLRVDGIGPVRVGMSLAQAAAAGAQPLLPDVDGACRRARPASGRPDVSFVLRGERIVRVDVTDDSRVQTLSGVRVGTPVAEVRRRYGARVETDGDRLRYLGPDGRFAVVFEIDGDEVVALRAAAVADADVDAVENACP